MKGAVILSGALRAYRRYIDNFIANFIEPNDLDVYCSFMKGSSYNMRTINYATDTGKDEHDEDAFLREKFGSRLKVLHWASETEFLRRLTDFQKFEYASMKQRYNVTELFNQGTGTDQFGRVAIVVEQMKQFCEEHQLQYDYVVRFRIDIDVTSVINIPQLLNAHPFESNRDVYIIRWVSCGVKELFFAPQTTMYDICLNFPHTIGLYAPKRYYDQFSAPEYQLGQFLRVHQYKLYEWNIEYKYVDNEATGERKIVSYPNQNYFTRTPILVTDFPSDMTQRDIEDALKIDPSLIFPKNMNLLENQKFDKPAEITVSAVQQQQDTSTEYNYMILWIVFLTLFVVTNLMWFVKQKRETRHGPLTRQPFGGS